MLNLLLLPVLIAFAGAVNAGDLTPHMDLAHSFFPEADRFGTLEGEPPAATVWRGEEVVGYVFLTQDIAPIPAYSGKPVDHLVGMNPDGTIRGARVVEHHEPILLAGIPEARLQEFVEQYVGKYVGDRIRVGSGTKPGYVYVDGVSGATVTVIVQNETILRAARAVAIAHGLGEIGAEPKALPARILMDAAQTSDWTTLTGDGSVRRLNITRGDVDEAFRGTPAEGIAEAPAEAKAETFIDLYYAIIDPPAIGRALLGDHQYERVVSDLKEGEHAIAVFANGIYSFRGHGFVRGAIFDRFQLTHGDRGISFRDVDHYRPPVQAEGVPEFTERGVFIIRDEHGFDPGSPWQIELLVVRQTGPRTTEYTRFTGDYALPEEYYERPAPLVVEAEEEIPLWATIWQEKRFQIAMLVTALGILTAIMLFHDWLVRYPRLLSWVRNGYLVFTLVVIGWYLLAQLSVVNVFTFTNAILSGSFRWDTFLLDPMMFILWTFVAVTLLLWGRGVYCGWLCPYGALQVLVNKIACHFKVPQFKLPEIVHGRLWALKYVILIVLFGISLQSLAQAEIYAEVEPFKTAIILHFARDWGYVLYAGGLVLISAFNEKFYCKYLCPLGAALAVPARLRLFDWLSRRKECGRPCQICAVECGVQAIAPTGEINHNECHYCLDCQVTYHNETKCPPLVQRHRQRERAEAMATPGEAPLVRREINTGTET